MYMASSRPEAMRAAEAGADVIVAQGSEGGGHVGWMATITIVPMVVSAVAPLPVLAAGGIADGRGLVAALALGAEGVLLGTRFLATPEAPIHENFKQAIVESDGHDTMLTEIHDLASGQVWPAPWRAFSATRLYRAAGRTRVVDPREPRGSRESARRRTQGGRRAQHDADLRPGRGAHRFDRRRRQRSSRPLLPKRTRSFADA